MKKTNIFSQIMTNTGSYAQQVLALLKGDDAAVLSVKVARQTRSTLVSALAMLSAEENYKNNAVETATEEVRLAFLNRGNQITCRDEENVYLHNLTQANNQLILAEKALRDHQAQMEFYQSGLDAMDTAEKK